MYIIILTSSCSITKNVGTEISEFTIDDFEVDKLGSYYLINKTGELRKFSSEKKLLYTFKNHSFGEIACVDVTNPHKILVFYKEFQTILMLDNTLSEISVLKLDDSVYFSAAGASNDGNLWLYDSLKNRINKISFSGDQIEESTTLNSPYPQNIGNSKIFDRENRLYIFDEKLGIIIFNNIGYFEKTIPLISVCKPEFSKNLIYYFDSSHKNLMLLETNTNQKTIIEKRYTINPDIAILKNNRTYLLFDNQLIINDYNIR